MKAPIPFVHGPAVDEVPLALNPPHPGRNLPADFGSVRAEAESSEGQDSFIEPLHQPTRASAVPLLAALFPRTGPDVNRHAGACHINGRSTGSNASVAIEGAGGRPRAEIVVVDRSGTNCAPAVTAFVHDPQPTGPLS